MIDPNYKIDTRTVDYQEPKSNVSWLLQQPSYKIDGYSLANAFMTDYREEKKRKQNGG